MARPKEKLLRSLIVLVDNTAIRARELNRMINDRGEYCLKIQTQTDGLSHLSQGFQFTNRSSQLVGSRFQFLEEPDVLNCNHRLVGKGFEQLDLLVREWAHLPAPNQNCPSGDTLAQERRRKRGPMAKASRIVLAFREFVLNL